MTRLHRIAPTLALLATLTGCAPQWTVAATRCDPARHQALVGRNIGEVTLPPSLPRRIISPGDVVAQDFSPQRLNIFVDPKGWIGRVTCG